MFFSRITLEDKLGQDYEPYIFSALNSAKVMLAVGTDYEYFNAVWVKNEWSRFLALMKNDKSKTLIPCYCDIDAYDMPQEFKHLQGQDMGKVGFIQDLVRGIGKIIPKGKQAVAPTVVQQVSGSPTTESLLKRAMMFLEEGDFNRANEYAEKLLDVNPENADAYLVKLCVDMKIHAPNELIELSQSFENNSNYQKALRFGNDIVNKIEEKKLAEQKRIEKERLAEQKRLEEEQKRMEEERIAEQIRLEEKKKKEAADAYLTAERLYKNAKSTIHLYTALRLLYKYRDVLQNNEAYNFNELFNQCRTTILHRDRKTIIAGQSYIFGVTANGKVRFVKKKHRLRSEPAEDGDFWESWNGVVSITEDDGDIVGIMYDGIIAVVGNDVLNTGRFDMGAL